eukprot:g72.t1
MLEKDEMLDFINHGRKLTAHQRQSYAKRGAFQKILVDFLIGCDKLMKKEKGDKKTKNDSDVIHPHERELLHAAIESIWYEYDIDKSNSIDAKEAKQMIIDITGHKKISEKHVTAFIAHIESEAYEITGQEPNGVLEKNELLNFLEHGIQLNKEQREIYAKRGAFQKTLVDFFVGCDKLMDEICDEHKVLLIKYIDSIWSKYDVDNSNSISLKEVKQLILDITGHDHVSDDECLEFIQYIESQSSDNGNLNNEIEKEELLSFLEDAISMSENERKDFGSRSKFHATLINQIPLMPKRQNK